MSRAVSGHLPQVHLATDNVTDPVTDRVTLRSDDPVTTGDAPVTRVTTPPGASPTGRAGRARCISGASRFDRVTERPVDLGLSGSVTGAVRQVPARGLKFRRHEPESTERGGSNVASSISAKCSACKAKAVSWRFSGKKAVDVPTNDLSAYKRLQLTDLDVTVRGGMHGWVSGTSKGKQAAPALRYMPDLRQCTPRGLNAIA